jgi:hypothetical protein
MSVSEAQARADRVLAVVRPHAEAAQLEWLQRELPAAGFGRAQLMAAFAGVGRRFRAPALALTDAERAALSAEGFVEPGVLSLADLARTALLLRAVAALPEASHGALAAELIKKGDTAERVAVLRALPLLPGPGRFVELAIDSCRSHVQEVFDAVACDNGYAARHFSEAAFNQMIMKAMFTGVPLERVHGWRTRVNAELSRMASDFAAERRAAGRPVPEGVAQIHAEMETR